MSDVFISYSRPDRSAASTLAEQLRSSGLNVWWDYDLVGGTEFRDAILQALHTSRSVVVIWSSTSTKSRWVRDEAEEGLQQGKYIPVRVPEVEVADLPLGFRSLQTLLITDVDKILRALAALGIESRPNHANDATTEPSIEMISAFVRRQTPDFVEVCIKQLEAASRDGSLVVRIAAFKPHDCAEYLLTLGALRRAAHEDEGGPTNRHRSAYRYRITPLGQMLLKALTRRQ